MAATVHKWWGRAINYYAFLVAWTGERRQPSSRRCRAVLTVLLVRVSCCRVRAGPGGHERHGEARGGFEGHQGQERGVADGHGSLRPLDRGQAARLPLLPRAAVHGQGALEGERRGGGGQEGVA